jgi:hypothetical protein
MTQPNDSSRTPEPRSDRSSDAALDCTTCSVLGVVVGLCLATVGIASWTVLSLALD